MHARFAHTHLVMLQFNFQAVQAVEKEYLVQFIVSIADEPPNCFSFCFKTFPGAQRCLEVTKK